MKRLEQFFRRIESTCRRGPLRLLLPLLQATEMFFLAPADSTHTWPHIRDCANVKRYMSLAIAALLPILGASIWLFGWRVLAIVGVTFAAGLSVEILFASIRKEPINEGFFVTGLIYPLILPPNLPLWMVALGIAFGVFFGKELFGGTGRNLFNPALVGRCFLALAYPSAMVQAYWAQPGTGLWGHLNTYAADAVTGATPLGQATHGQYETLSSLWWGTTSGSVGETSAVLILISGAALLLTGVISWRTLLAVFIGFCGLGLVDHLAGNGQPILWHILAGGFLFGAVFMATDPVTSPTTNLGRWIYGLGIGAITWLIRTRTGYVEGIMFAILLGNIAAPLLDECAAQLYVRRLRRER
ncbi:MAG: RnfABCDGE type electron transport complex subunit D [Phycisphaerae bacterium]